MFDSDVVALVIFENVPHWFVVTWSELDMTREKERLFHENYVDGRRESTWYYFLLSR
jgi:hypothetical protein